MHNNIMAVGSRDRPPMLATGRYAQWKSCFMRYIDTKPNSVAIRKCILQGPCELSELIIPAYYDAEPEAIHLILTRIGDDIYSTIDACKIAHDMWIAIERLQQGDSLNKQDVKTNLFWEFGRLTSRDGESIKSYYSKWSRFMTIVKQTQELDKESYHKLFDILKQYQKEVNEIRAEKIARNANPLALVAVAQQYPDTYYQVPKSHKSYAPPSKQSSSTRSHATTRNKGKEIAKSITPPSESAYEEDEDSDPEQAQRDKDMQKNLALIAKYFKKIYKPTNNNLKTSSNTRNKNVDTSPRYRNDNQTEQFGNQRTVTEFGHFAKECMKPKWAKDYTYHKEKMLMCKQAEKGVPLCVEQSDWLDDTYKEIDEQELEAHYSFMAKIQEVLTAESGSDAKPLEKVQSDAEYNVFANERQHSKQPESINDTYVVEKVDSNVIPDSSNMCDNDKQADQNAEECDDERVVLANLIANLKLDTDENKKIQKQLKKANTSLSHELKECKSKLEECKSILDESNRSRDRYLVALHDKDIELEKYKRYHDSPKPRSIYNGRLSFANPTYLKKAQSENPCLYEIPYDKDDLANIFVTDREETLTLEHGSRSKLHKETVKSYEYTKQNKIQDLKAQLQDKNIAISELKKLIEKMKGSSVDTKVDKPSDVRPPNALRVPNPSVLGKPTPFSDSL
ncbi:hypothetical protein Tco_0568162 [Tanacetum coccineum]